MDEIDRANDAAEEERARALAARRAAARVPPPGTPDCEVCGADIPDGRRLALPGCRTCLQCQAQIEQGMGR